MVPNGLTSVFARRKDARPRPHYPATDGRCLPATMRALRESRFRACDKERRRGSPRRSRWDRQVPYVAGLPGEQPGRHVRRRRGRDLGKRFVHPAPVLADQSELDPDHMAATHEIEPESDIAVRCESPLQGTTQVVDVGIMTSDPLMRRGRLPRRSRLSERGREVLGVSPADFGRIGLRELLGGKISDRFRAGGSGSRRRLDRRAPRTSRPATGGDPRSALWKCPRRWQPPLWKQAWYCPRRPIVDRAISSLPCSGGRRSSRSGRAASAGAERRATASGQ